MGKIVAPNWQREMLAKLDAGQPIDITSGFTKAIQWLIEVMSRRDVPFAIYNLGAGVKRVTTTTDKCPCCKKALV